MGITSVGAWNKKHLGKLGSHQWMLLPDDAIEAKARCALVMTGAKNQQLLHYDALLEIAMKCRPWRQGLLLPGQRSCIS